MSCLAQAPANIALIKYMGKSETGSNLPDNASLSYTLNNLLSTVQLECIAGTKDKWAPLSTPGQNAFSLSEFGQQRFIAHLQRLKDYFGYSGALLIQSCNNFPQGSGLASSASSFAALTKCAVLLLSQLTNKLLPTREEQAQLSRLGSGSSCRSFYTPWALWNEDEVTGVDLPYPELLHQVVVISGKEKEVSSSEAHKRVKTSSLYAQRPQRAQERLTLLLEAFSTQNWPELYKICWLEFQDMHQLFHTCVQPFSYISEDSQKVLDLLRLLWEKNGDGPIVTMDAGPNIHLLYRPEQADLAQGFKADHLVGHYDVL